MICRIILFLVGLLTAFEGSALAAAPERVVSLNLCVDQYLLALADREQIAALTQFASDPEVSAAAEHAEGIRQIRGTAEEVVRLNPDLVLGGSLTRRETRNMLRRMGYRIVDVPTADTFEAVRQTTQELANILGHPDRGERLIEQLDSEIGNGPRQLEKAPRALYYQRRGFANGSRSLVSEIMAAAGLRNMADELGLQGTGRVDLEAVVRARPDYLLVDSLAPRLEDQGTYLLRHPALLKSVPSERRIAVPQAFVICGGPMTASAIEHLKIATARMLH